MMARNRRSIANTRETRGPLACAAILEAHLRGTIGNLGGRWVQTARPKIPGRAHSGQPAALVQDPGRAVPRARTTRAGGRGRPASRKGAPAPSATGPGGRRGTATPRNARPDPGGTAPKGTNAPIGLTGRTGPGRAVLPARITRAGGRGRPASRKGAPAPSATGPGGRRGTATPRNARPDSRRINRGRAHGRGPGPINWPEPPNASSVSCKPPSHPNHGASCKTCRFCMRLHEIENLGLGLVSVFELVRGAPRS